MHPVNQVLGALLKQEGSSMARAMIQVLACFPHMLAVCALAIKDVLDAGHLQSGGTNAHALFGMP
jgi:hypothetical protein